MIRIRIGLEEGPLLKTLLDWAPRAAGEHIEHWDGKDKSGQMILLNHPNIAIMTHAYTIPDNSIIVTGSRKPDYQMLNAYIKTQERNKYFHALHPRAICHEPEIEIELPECEYQKGIPVLKGAVPVIIKIAPRDTVHLTNTRYEIIFFIDNIFLFEDEEGYDPFTYILETEGLPDGEHVITANVVSYDDHIGVATQKILVENR